jgi:DNA-binding transcriptional LysR family regulator
MSDLDWFRTLHRLNLNHLLTFLAVAEMRSFRAAAMLVHISQSALSVQVRQLEKDLGVPLLHRTTRTLRLTEEGKRLYSVSKRLSMEIAAVAADLKGEAALQRGVVAIAALPSLANSLLPKVMAAFAMVHPGIELKLHDLDSLRARELLRQGDLDVGVLSRNESVGNMDFTPLFEDEYFAVVPAYGHPLSSASSATPDELAAHPMMLTPRGSDLRESIEAFFARHGATIKPSQELISSHPMLALVGYGFGICVLPRMSLEEVDPSRCRLLRITPYSAREVGIVLPRGRSQAPALVAFCEFLKLNAAQLGTNGNAPLRAETRIK